MSGDGVKTTKPWYKSKTMWFNGLSTAVVIASQVAPVLPPPVQAGLAIAIPVVNLGLRMITGQPIGG